MYSLEWSHEIEEGYLLFQMHSLSVALQTTQTKFYRCKNENVKMKICDILFLFLRKKGCQTR